MGELERIRDQLKKLDDQIGRICNRKTKLEERESELICDKILTEELLNGKKWELQTWGIEECIQLTARGYEFPELVETIDPQESGYHFGIQLYDEVTLNYDDEKLSINFDEYSVEAAKDFIRQYNILVDMESVSRRLGEIEERVLDVRTIFNHFKNLEENPSGS